MRTYRIVEDVGGYYLSDDSLDYCDCRGMAYPSRRAAIAGLRDSVEQSQEAAAYLRTGSTRETYIQRVIIRPVAGK